MRAGEERWVARRLAERGIPIIRTIRGHGTFEGADAMWLDATRALVGRGRRTNAEGARQVTATLAEMGVRAIPVDLPWGAMRLMGALRIADRDFAIAWPGRLAVAAVEALRDRGYRVLFLPEGPASERTTALNFVTLAPGRILMAAGYPVFERCFEKAGLVCRTTPVAELRKAAGGIGCLTGILGAPPAPELLRSAGIRDWRDSLQLPVPQDLRSGSRWRRERRPAAVPAGVSLPRARGRTASDPRCGHS